MAEADLRKWVALVPVAALAVTLTIGSVTALVDVTIKISEIAQPSMRALATIAELLTGMFWLMATVYIATHLAVLIFGTGSSSQE